MARKPTHICGVCEAKLHEIKDGALLVFQTDQAQNLIESLNIVQDQLRKKSIVAVVVTHGETLYDATDSFLSELGLLRAKPSPTLQ